MFDLKEKVAIVTGGSRGIGRATAETLAAQGAQVVLTYVSDEAAARSVAETIAATGGKAEAIRLDVGDAEGAEKEITAIAKRLGRLDVLVANAGISIDALLLRIKTEDLDRIFAVNVTGAIACSRAAIKTMMRARTGRVIFLSSVVGEMGNVGQTAYSVSKAALIGAAKSIAREYASRNITVNAITPGFIDTDMTSTMDDKMKEHLNKIIPLARTGTAREVAAACVFLASDEAAYVTGQVLRVNGGMYV